MGVIDFIANHPLLSAIAIIVIFLIWQGYAGKLEEEKRSQALKGGTTNNGPTADSRD